MITIADLAQFAHLSGTGYRARTDNLLESYRHERCTELESDCYDRWSRVRFADGSEAIINDYRIYANNRNAVDWDSPEFEKRLSEIAESLN